MSARSSSSMGSSRSGHSTALNAAPHRRGISSISMWSSSSASSASSASSSSSSWDKQARSGSMRERSDSRRGTNVPPIDMRKVLDNRRRRESAPPGISPECPSSNKAKGCLSTFSASSLCRGHRVCAPRVTSAPSLFSASSSDLWEVVRAERTPAGSSRSWSDRRRCLSAYMCAQPCGMTGGDALPPPSSVRSTTSARTEQWSWGTTGMPVPREQTAAPNFTRGRLPSRAFNFQAEPRGNHLHVATDVFGAPKPSATRASGPAPPSLAQPTPHASPGLSRNITSNSGKNFAEKVFVGLLVGPEALAEAPPSARLEPQSYNPMQQLASA
eukprot:GHVT01041330.1.p1 GENE.GHVT01041330.1~~GHVT01041330.1.p1  ORF type:complete len:328 (+),score=65.16 GHVT01041330.1:327-1310(+)